MTSGVSALSGSVANGHQAMQHVSSDLSKIPYGGFSPVRLQTGSVRRHLHRLRRLIDGQLHRRLPASWSPRCVGARGRIAGAFRSRGPWLGVGLFCPVASSLTMASSELLAHSGRLMIFAGRSLPRGRGPEGPCFQLANPSVRAAFRTPADRAAWDDSTSARDSLRPNARGSASATSHLNRYTWVP